MISRTTAYLCQCNRCLHVWTAVNRPERCARCKSRKWNRRGDLDQPLSKPGSDEEQLLHAARQHMTARMDLP